MAYRLLPQRRGIVLLVVRSGTRGVPSAVLIETRVREISHESRADEPRRSLVGKAAGVGGATHAVLIGWTVVLGVAGVALTVRRDAD